jgi:hypothetical protein
MVRTIFRLLSNILPDIGNQVRLERANGLGFNKREMTLSAGPVNFKQTFTSAHKDLTNTSQTAGYHSANAVNEARFHKMQDEIERAELPGRSKRVAIFF